MGSIRMLVWFFFCSRDLKALKSTSGSPPVQAQELRELVQVLQMCLSVSWRSFWHRRCCLDWD